MIRAAICRLLRHDHTRVRIHCTTITGRPLVSHPMDRWSADWIIANRIAPSAAYEGVEVASCRIVVP